MLKKRSFRKTKLPQLRYGTIGIYCIHTFRFEYRYCLFFRKFFKKLFKKRKKKIRTLYRRKTWMFIRPNYTLTHKSKNARMGKGKGNFKRWCTIVYPGRIFIEHLNVSPYVYRRYLHKMRIKMKLDLFLIHKSYTTIKKLNLSDTSTTNTDVFDIIRVRRSLPVTQRIFSKLLYSASTN